ncbi:MAG: hypothetical protein DRJ40_06010 [Thermoprotei archaeon]|nr:MAG: hypothetical protein DRJ40_06010 [Thermoprotei archaeon]
MHRKLVLDDIDEALISELQKDGRLSLVDLGRRVGLRHSSVRSRLIKLVKENLIKVTALLNYKKLDLKLALVGLSVRNLEKNMSKLRNLCQCHHVVYLFQLVGGKYNVLLLFVYRNESKLRAFIEKRIRTIPDIDDIEVTLVDTAVPIFLPIRLGALKEAPICSQECTTCGLREVICTGCDVGR